MSVLNILRVLIFGSLFALWFLLSYIVLDLFDIGGVVGIDPKGKPEEIVAALANDKSGDFSRRLSHIWPMNPTIIGAIDLLEREGDGRLRMAGWALDKIKAAPLTVFVIIPTKAVLVTHTGAKRDDVWTTYRLSKEFESSGFDNVFPFQYDCRYNDLAPFIVAVDQGNGFSLISPGKKVAGCDKPKSTAIRR